MESTIIIPVFDRLATTVRCLENLHTDKVDAWAEIIVVDSGSSDGTVEEIRKNWPMVRLIETDPSVWWTEATRQGMEAASPSSITIIWLNDDYGLRATEAGFDVGGISDMVQLRKTGWLTPPFNLSDFISGACWCITQHNHTLRDACIQRAADLSHPQKVGALYKQLYQDALLSPSFPTPQPNH